VTGVEWRVTGKPADCRTNPEIVKEHWNRRDCHV
jgi:hypothetical protein